MPRPIRHLEQLGRFDSACGQGDDGAQVLIR